MIATVPRYVINLDSPVEERWNQIVDHYRGTFPLFLSKSLSTIKYANIKYISCFIFSKCFKLIESLVDQWVTIEQWVRDEAKDNLVCFSL